jgi:hypothetical protein
MAVAQWDKHMKPGLYPFLFGPVSSVVLRIVLSLLALHGIGPVARAGSWIMPSGLKPGDTFQLAFVTDGTLDGESTNIADYNRFVSAAAAAAGLNVIDGQAVTWDAIVSTPSVAARVNAQQIAPVYNGDGQLVTSNPGGLWATSQHFLLHPIDVTASGVVLSNGVVWTGTQDNGSVATGLSLGANPGALIAVGDVTSTYASWISAAYMSSTQDLRIYALSSPITLLVPEPSTVQLMVLGSLTLAAWRSIGHRRRVRGRRGSRAASLKPGD